MRNVRIIQPKTLPDPPPYYGIRVMKVSPEFQRFLDEGADLFMQLPD